MFGQGRFKHLSNYLICKKIGRVRGNCHMEARKKKAKKKKKNKAISF